MSDGLEKRSHPRVELVTEVRLSPSDPAVSFSTRNVSLGGIFIAADPERFPELKPGVHLRLRLCVADRIGDDIDCRAQIIRVVRGGVADRPSGFALRFFRLDMKATMRLGRLIGRGG